MVPEFLRQLADVMDIRNANVEALRPGDASARCSCLPDRADIRKQRRKRRPGSEHNAEPLELPGDGVDCRGRLFRAAMQYGFASDAT